MKLLIVEISSGYQCLYGSVKKQTKQIPKLTELKHIFPTLCISNVYFREPELGINAFVIRVQWQLCGTLVSVLNCKMHEQFIFANSQLYHLNF